MVVRCGIGIGLTLRLILLLIFRHPLSLLQLFPESIHIDIQIILHACEAGDLLLVLGSISYSLLSLLLGAVQLILELIQLFLHICSPILIVTSGSFFFPFILHLLDTFMHLL